MFDMILRIMGRRRQAKQIEQSRERVANLVSEQLVQVREENQIVSARLNQLVRDMQGRSIYSP